MVILPRKIFVLEEYQQYNLKIDVGAKKDIDSVVKAVIDSNNETEAEVLQTSGMIGTSGMQSGESALEYTTSQSIARSDNANDNQMPSPASCS